MTTEPQLGDLWAVGGDVFALTATTVWENGALWRAVCVSDGPRRGRTVLIGRSLLTDSLTARRLESPVAGLRLGPAAVQDDDYRGREWPRCDGNDRSGACLAREACTGPCRWFAP